VVRGLASGGHVDVLDQLKKLGGPCSPLSQGGGGDG
jgi:hypothetical protein